MRLAFGLATAAALALGLHGAALAQGQQDFILVNQTGYPIEELHISPSNSNEWGDNILGDDEMPAGASGRVRFTGNPDQCLWDIKVAYDDGDESQWRGVNLCRISRITLFWDRAGGTTRAVAE